MKQKIRASSLNSPRNYISFRKGLPIEATPYMKVGTLSEQIAFRGLADVMKDYTVVPSVLPENPATGKRFKDWETWCAANGNVDLTSEYCIKADDAAKAKANAIAIRGVVGGGWRWQVAGQIELTYTIDLIGTCDLVFANSIMDIKCSNNTEKELIESYQFQVSTYAHMHEKRQAFIMAIRHENGMSWAERIQVPVLRMEQIHERFLQLERIYKDYDQQSLITDLDSPFTAEQSVSPF